MREQYQAPKRLTLTLSLTCSHNSPRFEKYDRQSTVDLSVINPANGRPGAMIVTGLNGAGRAFKPHRVTLEPSASLAWNPLGDSKTVVRAKLLQVLRFLGTLLARSARKPSTPRPSTCPRTRNWSPRVRLPTGFPRWLVPCRTSGPRR